MLKSLRRHPLRLGTGIFAAALCCIAAYLLFRAPATETYPPRDEYPVRGIDISAHNLVEDWQQLADSIDFVFIKATEGGNWNDRHFEANYRAAKNAGLKVGAYHFFRYDREALPQAINFFNALWRKPLDFPAVIDVEDHGNPKGVDESLLVGRLRDMVAFLEQRDIKVMFYTNKNGYSKYIKPNFPGYDIWICSLSDKPSDDIPWTVWQFSHQGKVAGTVGNIDLNVLNVRSSEDGSGK